jgi:predicted dehydrogenase
MDSFKIVLAGCGGMANEWVKYARSRSDCQFVGMVDIKPENAAKMADQYSLQVPVFTQLSEALAKTGANLVFDVTIPECHKDIAVTALRAGCNVLGEKPMATTLQDAWAMVEAAKVSGKTYSVMQNRRYIRQGRAYQNAVRSGVIGKPGFICADFFIGAHFGGFRDLMDSPLILDMAIHTFDQARAYCGEDPVSVYCQEFNPQGSWYKGSASAVCIFEMTGGSVFCYRGSWCSEGCNTSWDAEWRIIGEKGTAVWDGQNDPVVEVADDSAAPSFISTMKQVEVQHDDCREGHAGCLDDMFKALIEGQKAQTDCTDNIKSIAMVFAAIQSAKEGRKVPVAY